MNNKPIIGIIGRSYIEDNNSIIKVNEDYRLAVVKSGGLPLIIIPTDELNYGNLQSGDIGALSDKVKGDLLKIIKICDGIVMTGGSHWYQFDEFICKYALDNDVPLLGICLGMQILGNIDNFCGTKSSDRTIRNDTYINHCQINIPYVHDCLIEQSGLLYDILKVDNLKVNSRHNYHIIKKDYFKIEAYSEDGLIEAISISNHKFALGVQWHPESMFENDNYMRKIFKKFVEKSKK